MATLREYFEKSFSHCARVHISIPYDKQKYEAILLYDFAGFIAFLAVYISDTNKTYDFFVNFISSIKYGETQFNLAGKITLPSVKEHPGWIKVDNKRDFEIQTKYFGDVEWVSTKNIQSSKRIYIYSESNLNEIDIISLKKKAREYGHDLQFRSNVFREETSKNENPLAFISHDSRDNIAKELAIDLGKTLCPVWYDEFKLKVGDNLRESIEKGLKECKRCILILSQNFLSNNGWTKKEFDSIFTREILEDKKLILPIWYGVSKQDVYEYSPSLLNVKALDLEKMGKEEVCRQIYAVVNSD